MNVPVDPSRRARATPLRDRAPARVIVGKLAAALHEDRRLLWASAAFAAAAVGVYRIAMCCGLVH